MYKTNNRILNCKHNKLSVFRNTNRLAKPDDQGDKLRICVLQKNTGRAIVTDAVFRKLHLAVPTLVYAAYKDLAAVSVLLLSRHSKWLVTGPPG